MEKKKEDLRVRKTKKAIRDAFEEMICEMDYEQIFYLHYTDLDDLLRELQDEIAETFIRQDVSYSSMKDIRDLVRLFFEHAAVMSPLHEKLLCNGSYQTV